MLLQAVDNHIDLALDYYAEKLEQHFQSHVISYAGPIYPQSQNIFLDALEKLKANQAPEHVNDRKLAIVLTTPGGVVEVVERMVAVTRHHFDDVTFVVPNQAMSAGTVWCMSGDRILMDYSSSLGPIDPQVQSANGGLVPALGYLDKVAEITGKQFLTNADIAMLRSVDLAELRRYEQARDLSISLLKQWLVSWKFRNWTHHRTLNPGTVVTNEEKMVRAQSIAEALIDNKKWHSHGRMIGIATLQKDLKLEIEDYTNQNVFRQNVRTYSSLVSESMERKKLPIIVHSLRS